MKSEEIIIEEEPAWKKILVLLIGLFLLLLILSYFLVSYPIFPILESIFESQESKGGEIKLEDFSIIFQENTFEYLQEIYLENQSVEFVACLKGEKIEGDYKINEIYQPYMNTQSFSHVSFKPCSKDTLILLHSHPFRRCIASQQDIKTLKELRGVNRDVIMVIMCEPNRFSVYEE